tara:strand:- start:11195 stop:11362 length:168 start_codon:yes stop_codon:yes gene_type:complete
MTEKDLHKMICYLADKVEKLERNQCKCDSISEKKDSPVQYKTNIDVISNNQENVT